MSGRCCGVSVLVLHADSLVRPSLADLYTVVCSNRSVYIFSWPTCLRLFFLICFCFTFYLLSIVLFLFICLSRNFTRTRSHVSLPLSSFSLFCSLFVSLLHLPLQFFSSKFFILSSFSLLSLPHVHARTPSTCPLPLTIEQSMARRTHKAQDVRWTMQ